MKQPNYEEIGNKVGKLISEKNRSYGDSFHKSGEIFKILFPKGIPVEAYVDVLAIARIVDKLFRICNDQDYNGENCWGDICGYAMLRLADKDNSMVASDLPMNKFIRNLERLDEAK